MKTSATITCRLYHILH